MVKIVAWIRQHLSLELTHHYHIVYGERTYSEHRDNISNSTKRDVQ